MKFRALLLSLILAAGMSLPVPVPVLAQDQQQRPPNESAQAEPAGTQDAAQSADAPKEKQNLKVKHDGGKDDVGAIGNRKVGGFDWFSIEADIKIGNAAAAEMEPHMKF